RRDDLWCEHQVALSDATLVDIGTHSEKQLPAGDLAADHPVERAAVGKLIGPLGNHAGAVQMLGLLAAGLSALLADPGFQILDRVTADAKLDQMQCHVAQCWRKVLENNVEEKRSAGQPRGSLRSRGRRVGAARCIEVDRWLRRLRGAGPGGRRPTCGGLLGSPG